MLDVLKLFADGGIFLYSYRTHSQAGSLSSQLAVMALVRTNWAQFLKSDSELPTDVVFRVEERNEREETNVEKVFAHKLLLAGASPVFRKQFFGALKEATDEVGVQDTTIDAFTTMIQFMYMAPEETERFALKIPNCAQSLCELVNISERYQILELNKMAKSSLENFFFGNRGKLDLHGHKCQELLCFRGCLKHADRKVPIFPNDELDKCKGCFLSHSEDKRCFSRCGHGHPLQSAQNVEW